MLASIGQSVGGPPRSVTQLSKALLDKGVDVSLLTATWSDDTNVEVDAQIRLVVVEGGKTLWCKWVAGFGRKLQNTDFKADVLHMHGLWLNCCREFATYARREQRPLIVAPRGMLEPWAMRHKAWKKKLAWQAFQKRDLKRATAFHSTAQSEAESIRRLGFKQPIAVIPNGIVLPNLTVGGALNKVPSSSCDGSEPSTKNPDPRTALFLSRINTKKGLPMLLDVWKRVAPEGWRLVIAGNDDCGHLHVVVEKIKALGLKDRVELAGPLFGDAKEEAYRNADLFVLPSYSENFGIVVAEALGYGVPVLTTTGCPWSELLTHDCGWWVEPTPSGIEAGLNQALCTENQELSAMGARGRELVEQKYQWPEIAERMSEFYGWIMNGGKQPDFVV